MTSKEIRQSFLDFFRSKDHRIVQSAPVIPYGDPTLLFTNAGMNQFKDVFLGQGTRDYKRAADTQKCIRVSGKHNDLEEVGVDTYHHTFFEMLGNWSFGDYYKEEAIDWAWELLVKIWGLDPERLHATVFRTDDEAYQIWTKYLPTSRIHRFDEKDNFWEMGETGPCGPCSEVHYDRTPDKSGDKLVNAGSPDVIEIWNLVFIQYNRNQDGSLTPLSAKHVDTGMGFERICAVLQGKNSNYDTDVFTPIINKIEELSNRKYSQDLASKDGIAMRVIADHLRALSFAIADGALPGNEGRGYVLRRLLRRAARFARNLGLTEPVIYKLLPTLIEVMGDVFPELISQKNTIERVLRAEEESFLQTLDRGLEKFDEIKNELIKSNSKMISGESAFLLYDTYGFPLDLTELLARENSLSVDTASFNQKMNEQRERSRAARKVHTYETELPNLDFETEFIGYTHFEVQSKVLFAQGNYIVLEKTPFYAESGGQVSDIGEIILAGETYNVIDVKKSNKTIIHITEKEVEPLQGQLALARVSRTRRLSTMRNHSATHLLHEALRQVLGSHVQQAGSLVTPDYLRFDFNHFEKVTDDEIKKIEQIVNNKIYEQIPVEEHILSIEEAKKNPNIKMFFGDKYGDTVRLIVMDNKFSMELCGGTHVRNTSEIGIFKIISESSIAAGIRRIEAITGDAVYKHILELNNKIDEKDSEIEHLKDEIKQLEKQLSQYKLQNLYSSIPELINSAKKVGDISVVIHQLEHDNIDELRLFAEKLRDTFVKNGISLLIAPLQDKITLVCSVTDDLKGRMPAGKLVGDAARVIGGGGGGKPHLATAGGKDISKLPELINGGFIEIVQKYL